MQDVVLVFVTVSGHARRRAGAGSVRAQDLRRARRRRRCRRSRSPPPPASAPRSTSFREGRLPQRGFVRQEQVDAAGLPRQPLRQGVPAIAPGRVASADPMSPPRPSVTDKRRAFHALHQAGCFAIPESLGLGQRALSPEPGLQGARDDELGLRVVASATGQRHHARHGARPPARDGGGDRRAVERGLRERLRGGRRGRGGKRSSRRGHGRGGPFHRGLHRQRGGAPLRPGRRRGTDPRRAARDRRRQAATRCSWAAPRDSSWAAPISPK